VIILFFASMNEYEHLVNCKTTIYAYDIPEASMVSRICQLSVEDVTLLELFGVEGQARRHY
jgi:hypothetical protein